jgi:hypothetical protein
MVSILKSYYKYIYNHESKKECINGTSWINFWCIQNTIWAQPTT